MSAKTSTYNITAIVTSMLAQLRALETTHPDYSAQLDDSNVDIAPCADLLNLIVDAPNEQVKFFLLGKLTMHVGRWQQ